MALRISEFVIGGTLSNTRRNRVTGWIEFAPDWGIQIELSGNLAEQFAGKHFRFAVPQNIAANRSINDMPEVIANLADRQIGCVGDLLLHEREVPVGSIMEFVRRSKMNESTPVEIKDVLYLEWFSQNGRIVAELVDPNFEFLEAESVSGSPTATPLPEPGEETDGPSITRIEFDEMGNAQHIESVEQSSVEDDPDNPYGLFDNDLDSEIRASLDSASDSRTSFDDGDSTNQPGSRTRSWDEVIPGIDPETKALYEHWDEVFHGDNDEPVTSLIDPPLKLPPLDSIQSDEAAQPWLLQLVSRLAQLNVAYDICEHCTPLSAYRILVDEVLPVAQVHPEIAGTAIVQHYDSHEFCELCQAEFNAEYEQYEARRKMDESDE